MPKHLYVDRYWIRSNPWRPRYQEVKIARLREAREAFRVERENMNEDIRPRGTVQVKCSTPSCQWEFWVEALDPRLPNGVFHCHGCAPEEWPNPGAKAPDWPRK